MLYEKLKINSNINKHESYSELEKDIHFWRVSFQVDKNYVDEKDGRGQNIIWKELCEKTYEYELKKSKTAIRPYAGSIIQKFRNYVFRNKPLRQELPEDFFFNVDLHGSTLDDFFSSVLLDAQIDGASYVLPDSTGVMKDKIMTLAQSRERNDRGFLRKINRLSVINWKKVDGFLTEAIVMMEDEEGNPFARYIDDEFYADISLDEETLKVKEIGELYPHGFSRIPLIECTTEFFPGGSQMSALAWSQKQIHNYLAQLGIEVGENTFTRFLLMLDRVERDPEGEVRDYDILLGPKRINVVETGGGANADLKSVGNASVDQADSIRKTLENEIDNLFVIAGLGSPDALVGKGEVRSGIAIELETNDLQVNLDSLTREIESVENESIRMLFESYEGTTYSKDFTTRDNKEQLLLIRDIISLDFPQEFIDELKLRFIENFE